MKKVFTFLAIFLVLASVSGFLLKDKSYGTYVGTQQCQLCHSSYYNSWQNTLHNKIHQAPGASTVRPVWSGTINMGATYSNATVTLGMNGSIYQATLNPASGSPVTYDIASTYGYGWKQRYLVLIGQSYFILPIQYNLNGYQDNSSGNWVTYNPNKWFKTDGTLLPIDNTFRKYSWDKNCSSCHITGNDINKVVSGNDTSYVSTWANSSSLLNMSIGCESCHGPGSDHVSAPSTSNIYGPTQMSAAPLARRLEVCGQCHSRAASTNRTYEYPYNETTDSSYYPGQVLANYYTIWQNYFNAFGGPGVWPDTMTARQHHQQWQDMSYSQHNNNMPCYQCHNPHAQTANNHQLKLSSDNNDICLQCHNNFGSIGNPDSAAITAHTHHPYDPTNQNQTGGASRCTKCHMAVTAITAKAYDIHSHNWKVVKPAKTLEKYGITTPTKGMLNSCSVSCHRNPGSANGTANVPDFGIATDSDLSNWNQVTDSLLADTLNKWFITQTWAKVQIVAGGNNNFVLKQNYPNPVKDVTTIEFTIPSRQKVSLKVFDLSGRIVYNLIDSQYDAGTYSVDFNIGDIFPLNKNNVLVYRLTAGKYSASKRMLLVN